MNEKITVHSVINAPIEKVWQLYTGVEHIVKWNYASDDWHTLKAENDLKKGGKFFSRMESKDGSNGFDFEGIYEIIKINEQIVYSMSDGRKVDVNFKIEGKNTRVTIIFECENINPIEMQRQGWQAILNNFKKYVEKFKG